MAYRLTWIAGLGLLGLVIARLSRLLLPTESGLPWPVVLIMAAALGGIVTWAATQARLGAVFPGNDDRMSRLRRPDGRR